jgi:hypothetical protein
LIVGLPDDTARVADYFDHFAWDGEAGPDPERQSAEAFLVALADGAITARWP